MKVPARRVLRILLKEKKPKKAEEFKGALDFFGWIDVEKELRRVGVSRWGKLVEEIQTPTLGTVAPISK